MDIKSSTTQILCTLAAVAKDLEQLTNPQVVTFRENLAYSEALDKVQEAIKALKKLDTSSSSSKSSQTQHKNKKSVLAVLKEIQIEGEPDWSKRHNEVL